MAYDLYEEKPVVVGIIKAVCHFKKYDFTMDSQITPSSKNLSTRKTWPRKAAIDWKDEKVWEKIKKEGFFHKSDELMVSCGTVAIDRAESDEPRVLLVFNKNIGIYQLPKGRKDFGEGYLDAAIRETTEETGIAVRPLRLRFGSRATPPRLDHDAGAGATQPIVEDRRTGITESLSNEAIVCKPLDTTPDPPVDELVDPDPATGAWRNIHWYAAKPRDNLKRDEKQMPIAEDRDKFSTYWFTETEALSKMKLEDEKFMVRVALEYVRNMSNEDWSSNKKLEKGERS
ncbi:hypothetical protein F5Y17DRAFT_476437 [Xylariaceae sp. FL0594]|nr:hypothetical protein F5Y17DRAFT_476437 [Xylariaceae sp. FL0594]